MMDYERWRPTAGWRCLGRWSGRSAEPVSVGCKRWPERLGGSVQWRERIRDVYTRYALYKSTPFLFTFIAQRGVHEHHPSRKQRRHRNSKGQILPKERLWTSVNLYLPPVAKTITWRREKYFSHGEWSTKGRWKTKKNN